MVAQLDAAKLVGLLADESRRRVVAALVLGARQLQDVVAKADIDARSAVDAIARLASAGLVVVGSDGTHVLIDDAFGAAARSAAPSAALPVEESERVIATFVREDRLISLPTQHSKRLVILDLIAQDFEPGLRYAELDVNAIVGRWHDDYAAIRRWLVDANFLTREGGFYWRSGGSVEA